MSNLIVATFGRGETYTVADGIPYQYNYGQELVIRGVNPSEKTLQVQFADNEKMGNAITQLGTVVNGDIIAPLPNELIFTDKYRQNYSLYAFVYATTETFGLILYKLKINVIARPKPQTNSPKQQGMFDKVVQEVDKLAKKAEGSAKLSESFAKGNTGIRIDESIDNAKYYKEQSEVNAKKTSTDRSVVAQDKAQVETIKKSVDASEKNVNKKALQIEQSKTVVEDIQKDVQTNKNAVNAAKKAVDNAQADVTEKAKQVENDRKKVEQITSNVGNPVKEHDISPTAHKDIRTELAEKANNTDIPTKLSELQNDSGYLTQHQDISGLQKQIDDINLALSDIYGGGFL